MVLGMHEGYKDTALSNRVVGIIAKKSIYEGVFVPTALCGAEAWGMRSAERRKMNVLELKFLRSLVGVSRMDSWELSGYRKGVGE